MRRSPSGSGAGTTRTAVRSAAALAQQRRCGYARGRVGERRAREGWLSRGRHQAVAGREPGALGRASGDDRDDAVAAQDEAGVGLERQAQGRQDQRGRDGHQHPGQEGGRSAAIHADLPVRFGCRRGVGADLRGRRHVQTAAGYQQQDGCQRLICSGTEGPPGRAGARAGLARAA